MLTSLQKLKNKLDKLEKELEKVRGCSPLTDGWQTQRYAKKSRKWDMLAQERMRLIEEIDRFEITPECLWAKYSHVDKNGQRIISEASFKQAAREALKHGCGS